MEDRVVESTHAQQQKEKIIFKNQDRLKDLWGNIKHTNICIVQTPQGEKRKGADNYLKKFSEEIAEKCPNLGKETNTHIEELQKAPNKKNPRRATQDT